MDFERKPDISKIHTPVNASGLIFTPTECLDKVEEIIGFKEKTLSELVGFWKNEYELMEKKHGEAMVGRILVDEELSKHKRELSELADQVARLQEDKMMDHEKDMLVAREKRMIAETEHWKREYELMKKKYGEEMMGRLSVDEEMSKYKRKLGELADEVARLEEEKRLNFEKNKVLEEREKRARDMYKGLLEDFEKVKRENRELMVKNTEFESARVKAERELESVTKKNNEFDLRITQLEGEVKLLMSQRREKPKVEEKSDKSDSSTQQVVKEVLSNGKNKENSSAGAKSVLRPCNEAVSTPNQKRQKTESAVVEISDSDDELPTQNQSCNVPNVDVTPNEEEANNNTISEQTGGRDENTSGNKRNISYFSEVGKKENGLKICGFMDWSVSSSDSDSDGDSCDTGAINRIIAQRGANKA